MMGSSNKEAVDASLQIHKQIKVVFVMGGPGSGKGTQCSKIVQEFGYTHLSAGDLLRDEVKSGSENGAMIHDLMNEGKLVASDVIVRLIVKAIQETDNDKFLLDGFPRNEDNLKAFENLTKIEPDFVLYLDCPEEEMIKRVLSRNQGREDDNIETIRKRFRVFEESTLPLVDYYASKGKLRRVDAARSVEEVFESVRAIFSSTEVRPRPDRHCNCFSFLRSFCR
ncbi:OLC1v1031473C10 [Oldenlandia corymbosa var. corymbosa]|uniref:UMP-CMP kinase n=1 Tax=Oldenlandia corymbosa var. corymbosa TaxID=529605 RepID=A0AAV1CIM5_OLDCO|nr:OLC1v1031473C10 [Oldenlandia corymbosa var. corymbosa]